MSAGMELFDFGRKLAVGELLCLMARGSVPPFLWDSMIESPVEYTHWTQMSPVIRAMIKRIQFICEGKYWVCITLRGQQTGACKTGSFSVTVEKEYWGISEIEIGPGVPLEAGANGEGQPEMMDLLNKNFHLREGSSVEIGTEARLQLLVCPFSELRSSA